MVYSLLSQNKNSSAVDTERFFLSRNRSWKESFFSAYPAFSSNSLLQYRRPFAVPRGPIHPHITFLCGLPAILPQHGQRDLVRMKYLVGEQFFPQSPEQLPEPPLVGGNHPVRHSLPGYGQPLKLLLLPVQRQSQRILIDSDIDDNGKPLYIN